MPDVPSFLIQAQSEIDIDTLAREHRLSTEVARLFSAAFAGFREDLIGDFMDASATGAEGEASWSLPLAQRLRIQDALLVEYQERLGEAEDEALDLLDEELPDAYEDGYLRYLWLLALGGLAVAARRPADPEAALQAAAIGGLTAQDRVRMWVDQSRAQLMQTLRANIVSEHTLPATLAALEPLERKTINGVVGLAANEGYYATQTGMTAAGKGYEDIPMVWMTRDENACDQCKFLHGKVTTLIPIISTHPACRCYRIPVPVGYRATPHAYAAFIGQL